MGSWLAHRLLARRTLRDLWLSFLRAFSAGLKGRKAGGGPKLRLAGADSFHEPYVRCRTVDCYLAAKYKILSWELVAAAHVRGQ